MLCQGPLRFWRWGTDPDEGLGFRWALRFLHPTARALNATLEVEESYNPVTTLLLPHRVGGAYIFLFIADMAGPEFALNLQVAPSTKLMKVMSEFRV